MEYGYFNHFYILCWQTVFVGVFLVTKQKNEGEDIKMKKMAKTAVVALALALSLSFGVSTTANAKVTVKKVVSVNKLTGSKKITLTKGKKATLKTTVTVKPNKAANKKVTYKSSKKAVASVTIEDSIVIHDVKIVQGKDGYFISMPSKKTPDGEYRDIVHPINTETREQVIAEILKAYEVAVSENKAE